MERAGASEYDQRKGPRVMTPFDGQKSGTPGHNVIDQREYGFGRLLHVQPERAAEMGQDPSRRLDLEP
jgi:hypothetical protein